MSLKDQGFRYVTSEKGFFKDISLIFRCTGTHDWSTRRAVSLP